MCMAKSPPPPETPEPPAPAAAPAIATEPELKTKYRSKRDQASLGKKKFRNDIKKTSNSPSKTTASGLQINT